MNRDRFEKSLLQACVVLGAGIPLCTGGAGMIFGTSLLSDLQNISFDSHFRYLSGLLFAIGLGFLIAVPHIERRTAHVRLLTGIVFIGGLARLYAALAAGLPSTPMILALGMELIVTPLLCLWQSRIARMFEIKTP